jgi:hypothetical protein
MQVPRVFYNKCVFLEVQYQHNSSRLRILLTHLQFLDSILMCWKVISTPQNPTELPEVAPTNFQLGRILPPKHMLFRNMASLLLNLLDMLLVWSSNQQLVDVYGHNSAILVTEHA